MSSENTRVAIILPTHNEGQSIYATLAEIENSLSTVKGYEFKLYIAEDGSKDNTRDEVIKFARNSKILTELAPESERLGYSRGVQKAISACSEEILVFLDSDGQYNPIQIELLINKLDKESVVCGVRSPRNDSFARKFYSSCFGLVFRILFGLNLNDPSSPFITAFKKDLDFLSFVDLKLSFGFWWEFQARISNKGLKVIEIPVEHRVRSEGKTQVYLLRKLPKIVFTHLKGLILLRNELS
jgi:glycosyltransferase involved in cell wall biosynthesis